MVARRFEPMILSFSFGDVLDLRRVLTNTSRPVINAEKLVVFLIEKAPTSLLYAILREGRRF